MLCHIQHWCEHVGTQDCCSPCLHIVLVSELVIIYWLNFTVWLYTESCLPNLIFLHFDLFYMELEWYFSFLKNGTYTKTVTCNKIGSSLWCVSCIWNFFWYGYLMKWREKYFWLCSVKCVVWPTLQGWVLSAISGHQCQWYEQNKKECI
jgi:hypothetical protein